MPVYKRRFKNGSKWCVDIRYPNGRRYRRVIGSKQDAELIRRKIESEIFEGKWETEKLEDVLFTDLTGKYLEYARFNKSPSTFSIDRYRIKAHLVPYFGKFYLWEITQQMIDDYKSMRIREGASPKTVNHELTNLSHMLKMAIRWRHIDHNAVSGVERMKVPKNPPRFLNQEEIHWLIKASKGSHIYPLIVTAIHTGMRKSELLNLRWSDIDFDQHIITVQSKSDWHTKNYKSRTIQLTPVLYNVLMEHRQLQSQFGVDSEYVFTYQGKRIKYSVDDCLKTVLKKAGIENVTLHKFRHTFASQLVMTGVSLRDVQELMGHQSFETTLQYAHLLEDHVRRQVLKLPFAKA